MLTPQSLAEAIARMEGWGVAGSLARRNNNPGNLRASSLAIGKDSHGFAIFPDEATGWAALQRQINLDANRGLNLEQFIGKYAPPTENDTSNYLRNVMAWTGLDRTAGLAQPANGLTLPQPSSSFVSNLMNSWGLALSNSPSDSMPQRASSFVSDLVSSWDHSLSDTVNAGGLDPEDTAVVAAALLAVFIWTISD